jgi:hypothetical protein
MALTVTRAIQFGMIWRHRTVTFKIYKGIGYDIHGILPETAWKYVIKYENCSLRSRSLAWDSNHAPYEHKSGALLT